MEPHRTSNSYAWDPPARPQFLCLVCPMEVLPLLQCSFFLQTRILTSPLLHPSPQLKFKQFKESALRRLWETIRKPNQRGFKATGRSRTEAEGQRAHLPSPSPKRHSNSVPQQNSDAKRGPTAPASDCQQSVHYIWVSL